MSIALEIVQSLVSIRRFVSRNMAKFPNQEGLNKALNECRVALREFIFEHLGKKVHGETVEELIERVCGGEPRDIGIKGILDLFLNKDCWINFFQRRFGYNPEVRRDEYDIRSMIRMIHIARNELSHIGAEDLDDEFTRAHLFVIADVLKEIGKLDARREVETIRNQLFSDETEEHPVEAVKVELEKRLKTTSDQLETEKAEKVELQKSLKAISKQLEEVETEWIASEERLTSAKAVKIELEQRLETTLTRLEYVEVELDTYKEDLARTRQSEKTKRKPSTIAKRFRAATTLEDRVEIGRKVAALRINAAGSRGMPWREIREELRRTEGLHLRQEDLREVIRREDHFKESVVERIESFENGWEYGGKLEDLLGFKPIGELANRIEACRPSTQGRVKTVRSLRYQRKWRRPGAVAALRNPTEIREAEAKIARILNPSEKSRLERELREAKRAVDGS